MLEETLAAPADGRIRESARLVLRELEDADAAFVVELVNDPDWLRHIGDRNVRTVADACRYMDEGPRASYRQHGFGLWLVERKADGAALGLCGLLQRETLYDADLGFAFLPMARGHGYAFEAAEATLAHGRDALGLPRVVAIVSAANRASIALLGRLDFVRSRRLSNDGARTTDLYTLTFQPDPRRDAGTPVS